MSLECAVERERKSKTQALREIADRNPQTTKEFHGRTIHSTGKARTTASTVEAVVLTEAVVLPEAVVDGKKILPEASHDKKENKIALHLPPTKGTQMVRILRACLLMPAC